MPRRTRWLDQKKYVMEKKFNGFRAVMHKDGDDVKIFSEGRENITESFPELVEEAKSLTDKDFIVDGELVFYEDDKPQGRAPLIDYVIDPEDETADGRVKYHIFDVIYYTEDISDEPWNKRHLIKKNKLEWTDHIKMVKPTIVTSKEEMRDAAEMYRDMDGSEGAMIKTYDHKYPKGGETGDWIKYKYRQHFNARVIDSNPVEETEAWTYEVGIDVTNSEAEKLKNDYIVEKDGNKILKLGGTFNTSINLDEGDVCEVAVEQVWRHKYKTDDEAKFRYSIHKPTVVGKAEEDETASPDDLDDLVVSRGQEVIEEETEMADDEEGGTRSEAAKEFWNENWHNMYPDDGEGEYVYQLHWRGLSEKEAEEMSHKELLEQGKHSIHGDLRGEKNDEHLWGFTVFEGDAKDIPEETKSKLLYMAKNKGEESFEKLQGQFKLRIPHGWLDIGKEEPHLSEPGGVGSTDEGWSKFFALDWGDYKIGVWHSHYFEYFFDGDEMNGRCIIMYAPIGGTRKWLIDFPEDQTPEAQSMTLDDKVKELRESDTDHKWLIWNDPANDKEPKKINIKEYNIEEDE